MSAPDASLDPFCASCGYNLRGISSQRCPECGTEIDWANLNVSRIPWASRRQIGRIRAYWRTVWMFTFHPFRAAQESVRPVRLSDARRFQAITVTLAWLCAAVPTVGLASMLIGTPWVQGHPTISAVASWGTILILAVTSWLFLLAATGAPSYFFHPRWLPPSRQDRCIAISYYSCAPLAWLPLLALAVFPATEMAQAVDHARDLPMLIPAALVWLALFACVVLIWVLPAILLSRSTHCSQGRVLLLVIAWPFIWVLLAALVVGLPVFILHYILFIILSFL